MRIALAGTYPPLRSGITDYTLELGRALVARGVDVVLVGEGEDVPAEVDGLGPVAAPELLASGHLVVDAVLCQVGSHPAHRYVRSLLLERRPPGVPVVVDLHDWSLYDLTASCFLGRPLPFLAELFRNEGVRGMGRALGTRPPPGRGVGPRARLRYALAEDPARRERFRLNRWVLDAASAVIVHNPALAVRVRDARPDVTTLEIPHGVRADLEVVAQREARARLGLAARGIAEDAFLVLSFGLIQRHKRIPSALEAFARLTAMDPAARYVLLGPRCPEYDLDRDLERLGLGGRVVVEDGFPPITEVALWIQAADVGLNLRGPSYGGVSGTLLKMMSLGLPTVATPVPELSDLPEGAVRFVPADRDEVPALAAILQQLRAEPARAGALGEAGRQLIRERGYRWPEVARVYEAALGQVVRPR